MSYAAAHARGGVAVHESLSALRLVRAREACVAVLPPSLSLSLSLSLSFEAAENIFFVTSNKTKEVDGPRQCRLVS